MAYYTRFEIYIPVVYRITDEDPQVGKKRSEVHALSDELLREFIDATRKEFEGITQANPVGPAPFKGWWQKKNRKTIVIDHLTYVFGLAKIHESDDATRFFSQWKERFESSLEQQEILVIYFPVQTIGDFF